MKDITNKKRKKNFNPLLPESTQLSDDKEDVISTPSRIHSFAICTNTSKIADTTPSKFYNLYCMLFISNLFLIGAFLLFFDNALLNVLSILLIVIGLMLNAYTIWTFCGHRLCPRWFKHENKLVFDDDVMKMYIHWNEMIKQSTFEYNDFARLYVAETASAKYGIVFIATRTTHYRFNKYLCEIESAKQFVLTVNNWWNVDRLEQKERMYDNRNVLAVQKRQKDEEEQKTMAKPKTKHEIYLENEKALSTMIKAMKYKSFSETDIENAFQLNEFFESKFRQRMVEEYGEIKMDLLKKEKEDDQNELIFKNEAQYITSALLLKFQTLEQLIQKRKRKRLEIMIEENKRNKITFSDDEDEDQEQD